MFFHLDLHSDVAIYLQVVHQVKFAVAAGSLRPGQLLPSVRALSAQLATNPNTVARAFTTLQTEGVIEALRGRGMVVREAAVEICQQERLSVVRDRIGTSLREAWNAGLSREQIQMLIDARLDELAKTQPTVNGQPSIEPPQKPDSENAQ